MTLDLSHLDEAGQPCAAHPASADAILTFAAVGSRVASFNHDIASKLQGMMMALDEIGELVENEGDPDLRRAAESAQQALKEASALLTANRSLTRTSTKTRALLRDVVRMAGERVGVDVRGDVPDGDVEFVVPLLVQGLCLAIDAFAGTGRGRFVDVRATLEGEHAQLVFSSAAEPGKALGDALAIASFVVKRAGGELRCGANRMTVRLPLAR